MRRSKVATKKPSQRRNTRRMGVVRRRTTRSMAPIGYGYTFKQTYRNAGNATIPIHEVFTLTSADSGLSMMIPLTLTKWTGSRAINIAGNYIDARPLKLRVSWRPTVATSTSGSVAIGTVFSGARMTTDGTYDQISKYLASTNGGVITTIWKPVTTEIQLKKNLRANNFPQYDVQPDDIPLWIVVATSDTSGTTLGQIYIDAVMSFKNPTTPSMTPAVNAAGDNATIEHTAATESTPAKTELKIDSSAGTFTAGAPYYFNFAKNLLNSAGKILVPSLMGVAAEYIGISGDKHVFKLDPDIATLGSGGTPALTKFFCIGRAILSFLQ